jgi:sigma-E factor negative regulatory protein RseB
MSNRIRWHLSLLGAALLAGAAPAALAGSDEALGWILRMNKAVVESNYEGIFRQTTSHNPQSVQVMKIIHRYKDGEMVERVISMDNSGYEQKRKGASWAEFLPGRRQAHKATRSRSYGYIPTVNGLDATTARNYEIRDVGPTRLIGRDVQQIHIDPRDNLRYGYRFWIDHQSALPLKLQRVSSDGAVVKEIAFEIQPTQLSSISDERLMVAVDHKGFRWVNLDQPMTNPLLKRAYAPQAALLPAGYRMPRFSGARDSRGAAAAPAAPRSRFMVSDGVSWGEVFITPISGKSMAETPKSDGGAVIGITAVYRLRLDDVHIVVTGEIPMEAARTIAEAVRPE